MSPTTDKPTRSSSIGQEKPSPATIPRSRWRRPKPWPQSSPLKRKHQKNVRQGQPKWYLEPIPSLNTADNPSTEEKPSPEPPTDPPTPKLGKDDPFISFILSLIFVF